MTVSSSDSQSEGTSSKKREGGRGTTRKLIAALDSSDETGDEGVSQQKKDGRRTTRKTLATAILDSSDETSDEGASKQKKMPQSRKITTTIAAKDIKKEVFHVDNFSHCL